MRSRSVGPQLIEFVKIAQFGLKDMHQHISVIHHDPNAIVQPFDPPYFLPELLEHLLFNPRAIASTCVVESALQMTNAGQTAPSNALRSSDTIFFGFLILYSSCNRFDQFTHKLLSVLRR